MNEERWTQEISDTYRQLAAVAVPARPEQIAALLLLLPFAIQDHFRVVELASGEGRLSAAILSAFPNAQVLALDIEESMREETAARLARFGSRATVAPFDMNQPEWYPHLEGADVVVSSLCVHHLTATEKQTLFAAVGERLATGGAFLLADIIHAQRPEANRLFAATWDRLAEAQSAALAGDDSLYALFNSEHWNYFHYPDPFDKPSPLFAQLLWLQQAGFAVVDCFWMQAGHAIYGGYKTQTAPSLKAPLDYAAALNIAQQVLA